MSSNFESVGERWEALHSFLYFCRNYVPFLWVFALLVFGRAAAQL